MAGYCAWLCRIQQWSTQVWYLLADAQLSRLEYSGIFCAPLIPVGHSCVCYERCEVCAVSAGVTCETSHVNNVVWLCDKGRHQISAQPVGISIVFNFFPMSDLSFCCKLDFLMHLLLLRRKRVGSLCLFSIQLTPFLRTRDTQSTPWSALKGQPSN